MNKKLVIYSIAKEKARLAFGAAIHEIDATCVDVIDSHSFAFKSNKKPQEIFKLLIDTGIEPPDEIFILTLDKPFAGIGLCKDELSEFLNK